MCIRDSTQTLLEKVETGNQGMANEIRGSLFNTLREVDQANQKRFSVCESRIAALEARMDAEDRAKPSREAEVDHLRRGLAIASAPVPPPILAAGDFDRDIDPCIVRIRTSEVVSKDSAFEGVQSLIAGLRLDDPNSVQIEGKVVGKSFALRFSGAPGLAGSRVRKFLGMQKSDGEWQHYTAKTPSGAEARIFLDIDKNQKTTRTELIARKSCRTLKETYPAHSFFLKKADSTVCVNWVPLLRVQVESPQVHKLEWNPQLVEELGIDRSKVAKKVEKDIEDPHAGIQWG